MGFFGLVLDNIIDMTVVLANGTVAHVSSTLNPDLYWAMKGAGHNFGIVTEANFKIYDPPMSHWVYAEFTFADAEHQLESLFKEMNNLSSNNSHPKELGTVYPVYAIDPRYSKTEVNVSLDRKRHGSFATGHCVDNKADINMQPVIVLQFSYAGSLEQAQPWLDIFSNLHPAAMWRNDSLLPTEIQGAASQDVDSAIWYVEFKEYPHSFKDFLLSPRADLHTSTSELGSTWRLFPVGLKSHNVTANRAVYNLYKQLINEHPEFSRSVVQFESYALEGMKAVDPASTAYAHRDDDILV